MPLTTEQRTELLKSASQSIISYRRRLESWSGPPERRQDIEDSMHILMQARNNLEEEAA